LDSIVIVDNTTIKLQAERLGGSNGCVYTLNYKATNASCNTVAASATVQEPHSNNGTVIDSGVHSIVMP